jgi:hypothetical protein
MVASNMSLISALYRNGYRGSLAEARGMGLARARNAILGDLNEWAARINHLVARSLTSMRADAFRAFTARASPKGLWSNQQNEPNFPE